MGCLKWVTLKGPTAFGMIHAILLATWVPFRQTWAPFPAPVGTISKVPMGLQWGEMGGNNLDEFCFYFSLMFFGGVLSGFNYSQNC